MSEKLDRIFTHAALQNIEETGADWREDLRQLRAGEVLEDQLLERCLDGADEDREDGWHDYVRALAGLLEAEADEDACRADYQMDAERDDRLTGDR